MIYASIIIGLFVVVFNIELTTDASNYLTEHYPKLLQLIKESSEQSIHYFVSHNYIKKLTIKIIYFIKQKKKISFCS